VLLVDDILHPETELADSVPSDILHLGVEHGIVQRPAHQEFQREVVDTLLVLERLVLLRLVPADHELVADGERGSGIGGRIVTVVHRTGQRGLDMADNLPLSAELEISTPSHRRLGRSDERT